MNKCFCGENVFNGYHTCGLSHSKIYNSVKHPKFLYDKVMESANEKSDISWYEEDGNVYRVDVMFCKKEPEGTSDKVYNKISIRIRNFNDENDLLLYI